MSQNIEKTIQDDNFSFLSLYEPIKVTNMAKACMNVAKKIQKYMTLISWSACYVINVRDISIPLATSYCYTPLTTLQKPLQISLTSVVSAIAFNIS